VLIGNKIYLSILSRDNYGARYVEWLRDASVTRFLETKNQTVEEIEHFIDAMSASPRDHLFGIFEKANNRHIGNIKLGFINQTHRFAEIGLLIGEKDLQGQGIGTEAIGLISKWASEHLKLHKLLASMNVENIGSHQAFLRNTFREVGRYHQHRYVDGQWQDEILMEKIL
jgi:ribosomal-protein-alanine N-acetyltransferase